jgi:ABC-type transport system involved in multi-copper enzyme maturation permease subunit
MTLPSTSASLPRSSRRPYANTTGRQAWVDGVLGVLLLVFVAALCWYTSRLAAAELVAVWVLFFGALALLSRQGRVRLFGPVLFYDLVRVGRRSRYFLLRCLYAGILAIIVYWKYSESFGIVHSYAGRIDANRMATFASQFFNLFMLLQFFLVIVLTPAYAASNIAEEKERKTLEFLLATDLRNREIVLSKVTSRLANLALILLTGVPILSFMQFLGGVDPDLATAGFAATGVTLLSLVAISTLASVYAGKPRDAILLTYLSIAAYMALGYLIDHAQSSKAVANFQLGWGRFHITLGAVIDGYNAGNLPIVLVKLNAAWTAGTSLATLVSAGARSYLVFHFIVALSCCAWAVVRVRAVALRQRSEKRRARITVPWFRLRPRLRFAPMVWKELFIEPGFRLTKLGWLVALAFVGISLVPAFSVAREFYHTWAEFRAHGLYWHPPGWAFERGFGTALSPWVRTTGTIVACLMLVGVAIRASTSITGERDRDTLDALLGSPLKSHDILFAKWLGSLLSVRWAWAWLGLIWGIGVVTRALHPLAAILLVIAWLVYASCFAGIGLWFSTSCRTGLRATLWTLLICAMVGIGHWGIWMCFVPFAGWNYGNTSGMEAIFGAQSCVTPPMVLYLFSQSARDFDNAQQEVLKILSSFGLVLWALAGLFLWNVTRTRFRKISSRMPYRRRTLEASLALTGLAESAIRQEYVP